MLLIVCATISRVLSRAGDEARARVVERVRLALALMDRSVVGAVLTLARAAKRGAARRAPARMTPEVADSILLEDRRL
jgi:hypothetical protein